MKANQSLAKQETDHTQEIRAYDRWLCWQYRDKHKSKPTKVPVDPENPYGAGIDGTDTANGMSYEAAKSHLQESKDRALLQGKEPDLDGVGFIRDADEPFVWIDVDTYVERVGDWSSQALRLREHLDTYMYHTPHLGFRAIVLGTLEMDGGENRSGGYYEWVDPETGEVVVFEVYDRAGWIAFTDDVAHDVSIKEAQCFLNSLSRVSNATRGQSHALPEVELPNNLEFIRRRIKALLLKHDCSPYPIVKGTRKNTLLSYFRKVVRNEDLFISEDPDGEPDELWEYLSWTNQTMLYDESGHLLPLHQKELTEIYDKVIEQLPAKSSPRVQKLMEEMETFLELIYPSISCRRDRQWKLAKGFVKQGIKYGRVVSNSEVKVGVGQITLTKLCRFTRKTLNAAIRDYEQAEIMRKGRDEGDRTNHYVIDLERLKDFSFWEIEDLNLHGYTSVLLGDNRSCVTVQNSYEDLNEHSEEEHRIVDIDNSEIYKALTHTTWYRGLGPTALKYISAIFRIQSIKGMATNKEIAEVLRINPTSTYRKLNELQDMRMFNERKRAEPYQLKDNFLEDLHRLRLEKGEYDKDERAKQKAARERVFYNYQMQLKNRILEHLQSNLPPDLALSRATREITAPVRMSDKERGNRQMWALRGAEIENSKEDKKQKRSKYNKRSTRKDIERKYMEEVEEEDDS